MTSPRTRRPGGRQATSPAQARRDASLGMHRAITRRDFLHGMPALAGLLAACRTTGAKTSSSSPGPGGRAGSLPSAGGPPGADPFSRGMPPEFGTSEKGQYS